MPRNQQNRVMRRPFSRLDFAARLRARRLAVGLTQDELAARCDAAGSAIGHYETGFSLPSIDRLHALAAALECSIDELLIGETPKRSHHTAQADDEVEALQLLRRLSLDHRQVALATLRALVKALTAPRR